MTTEKSVVSYTVEQTATAVADYAQGASVEAIAATLGKTVRSVIAKLSNEGVYKAPVKAKASRVTKAMLISAIAVKFHVEGEALASLEKADKATLEILAG
jgi:transposase